VFEYPHPDGLSITGGFVYRGRALPELDGWYVFADYVTRRVWAIRRQPDDVVEHTTLLGRAGVISSFAQGHDGELLVIDHQGPIWRLVRDGAP
jgi:glucose/arabinose dehydrogenase